MFSKTNVQKLQRQTFTISYNKNELNLTIYTLMIVPKFEKDSENGLFYALPDIVNIESDFEIRKGDFVTYTEDGTVVYLYYNINSEEWVTGTKNKNDARFSRFSSSRSFDELFWEIVDKENVYKTFDKNCTYTFILKHIDNRIVINHCENQVVFLSKIDNSSGTQVFEDSECKFTREKELCFKDKVGDYEYSSKFRGVLVKREGMYYMYDFDTYKVGKQIRGNTPDILYRYIALIGNKKMFKLAGMYPEEGKRIGKLNKDMYDTCIDIHNNYRCGKSIKYGHSYYNVIKNLHRVHGKNAELDDVFPLFYKQSPSVLYKLLCM